MSHPTRFSLVVASLHHPTYGFDPMHSSMDIRDHFLCIYKSADAMPKQYRTVQQISNLLRKQLDVLRNTETEVGITTTRNFFGVMDRFAIPQIGETIILPGDEMVVILKTVWIRLLQRTWKKVCVRRGEVTRKRSTYQSLKERERTGMWPPGCRVLPGLRGMMAGV
jgi:hypothetical protein